MKEESTMNDLLAALDKRDAFYTANGAVKPFPYKGLDRLDNRVEFFATELRRKVYALLAAEKQNACDECGAQVAIDVMTCPVCAAYQPCNPMYADGRENILDPFLPEDEPFVGSLEEELLNEAQEPY